MIRGYVEAQSRVNRDVVSMKDEFVLKETCVGRWPVCGLGCVKCPVLLDA